MWSNKIRGDGITELASGLKLLPNLSHLDLYNNMVKLEDFRCLSDTLIHLSHFEHLDIRLNVEETSASYLYLKDLFQHVPKLDL